MFGNRRGPDNQGPRTGRGMGYCNGYNRPGFENDNAPRRHAREFDRFEGAYPEQNYTPNGVGFDEYARENNRGYQRDGDWGYERNSGLGFGRGYGRRRGGGGGGGFGRGRRY